MNEPFFCSALLGGVLAIYRIHLPYLAPPDRLRGVHKQHVNGMYVVDMTKGVMANMRSRVSMTVCFSQTFQS